jgi:competence protein ComEA
LLSAVVTYLVGPGGEEVGSTIVVDTEKIVDNKPANISVDLSGAVVSPGVYKLPSNSRIIDLIDVGGGVLTDSSANWVAKNLNLSEQLHDSQKVYIPFDWDIKKQDADVTLQALTLNTEKKTTANNTSDINDGKINVNTATREELESLPRVGEVTAGKIIENRTYTDISELRDKTGLSANLIEEISELITFGS